MTSTVGDRLTDETGEDEVIGRPYTINIGKSAHVRVKRVDNAEVTDSDLCGTRAPHYAGYFVLSNSASHSSRSQL